MWRDSRYGKDAGASPRTFPDHRHDQEAKEQIEEVIHRPPRQFGIERSRWTVQALGRVFPWLARITAGGASRLLRRLQVVYRRGQESMHSPDPEYDAKLAAVRQARQKAQRSRRKTVFLYEDELTYYRRPSVARTWNRQGGPGAKARQGCRANSKRRVIGALNAQTGRLTVWQRSRADAKTMGRYLRALENEYPQATTIYVALDNWPVHFHELVQKALAGSKVQLLRLPTYAPWTNPIEKVWRWLKQDVLHQHEFQDDWESLQAAVAAWLDQWRGPSPELLYYVGLAPK